MKSVRMAACLLAVCLALRLAPLPARAADSAGHQKRLEELSGQLVSITREREGIKEKISGASTEKEKKLAEKMHWESQISLTRREIDILQERIGLLEEEITGKQEEITGKQEEIDRTFERYKKRMRAAYMAKEPPAISMLWGASDLTDLLIRSEFVRATAEYDERLVRILRDERAALEEAKRDLEHSQRAIQADEDGMQAKRQELEEQLHSTEADIQSISMLEEAYLSRQAELQAMDEEVQAQLDKIYAEIKSSGEYVGGKFGWPVPGYTTLTSYYGWRFNNTNFHTGLDISGSDIYGASVVAANSGTVAYVQTTYTDGVGYGKYVIVDHGGGYTTLYGHLSSVSVAVGDVVARGVSEVGKVGSTGWSTGPHLHFEVRVDGKHQNPLGFLKSKD